MRAGSVRVARQAGRRQAARVAMVMTTDAEAKANGSRGLTLYKRLPSRRVEASATAAPRTTPAAVRARPGNITRRRRVDAPAPRARRKPGPRLRCETV